MKRLEEQPLFSLAFLFEEPFPIQRLAEYEEVSLTYQKIEWTWNEGGISASDDWETPR